MQGATHQIMIDEKTKKIKYYKDHFEQSKQETKKYKVKLQHSDDQVKELTE